MKTDTHPVQKNIKVNCNCGQKFEIVSVYSEEEMYVEVCHRCHPFYTGQQKIVDTAGRVDKFRKRYGMGK